MDGLAVQEPRSHLIEEPGVPVHPVPLAASSRLGAGEQRRHPVGEPDGRQGPVRQVVVFDHRVTGREDLVHDHVPLHGDRRVGAHVLLCVNPFDGDGREATPLRVGHHHFLAPADLAGEHRRHPVTSRAVAGHEEEVRGGEGDLLARVGLDDVEEPPGGRVPVYERDEVAVGRVAVAVRRQHPVAALKVFHQLLGAVLEGDRGGSWETASGLCRHRVFCRKTRELVLKITLRVLYASSPNEKGEEWGVPKPNCPPAVTSLCINTHIVVGHMHFA